MGNLLILLAYITVSVFGLYQIKNAGQVLSIGFAVGLMAYAAGFVIWLLMLARLPLSVAFPIAAGGLIAATQIVGHLFLREHLSAIHLCAVALIVAGVSLLLLRN